MKWFLIPILVTLNGCAYTVVSTTTYVVTGKSMGDHAASIASGNDCDATRYAFGRQDYWCERAREPGTTYNRTGF